MALQYKFFRIPIQSMVPFEEEINGFLRSVRVVHVQREFVDQGENSFWALAIEYMPIAGGDSRKRARVDYKTLLSPEDFTVFANLRGWRKGVAAEEGVPVYAIFTNEQLAKIAESRIQTPTGLAEIDGVGKSRISKYAEAVIEIVTQAHPDSQEKAGE